MKLIKYNFSKFVQPTLDKHIKQKLIIKIFCKDYLFFLYQLFNFIYILIKVPNPD